MAEKIERSCAQCEWWGSDGANYGRCRGGPPVANYTWPVTAPTDWCGAWRLKESLIGGVDVRLENGEA